MIRFLPAAVIAISFCPAFLCFINHRHSSALRERLSAEAFATAARGSVFDFSLGELVDDGLDCLAMAPSGV
jgi:hypothetical protein